jgi:hypothetical protein
MSAYDVASETNLRVDPMEALWDTSNTLDRACPSRYDSKHSHIYIGRSHYPPLSGEAMDASALHDSD